MSGPDGGDPAPGAAGAAGSAGPTFGFQGLGRQEVVTAAELTPVDDYLAFVLQRIQRPRPIRLRSADALGLVLAQDVVATEPLPAFANAAMDGYALVAQDTAGATVEAPRPIRVVGEVAAGAAELPVVQPGQAVRIMTGAPLPPGADAVVPVEQTSGSGDVVHVHVELQRGRHIRRVGEDVQPGQRLLAAGRRIGAADIALMAASGHANVEVYPAPRVVVVSTGDELVPADRQPAAGQIRDSNGPMLAALVRQAGGVPFVTGGIPDTRRDLLDAFDANLGHADLFVSAGGVSAGKHDHLRDVVAALGEVHAFKVAMKPGMPQVFGLVRDVPVLALPGNPVSAFVSFEVFVRPAIRQLQGRRDRGRPVVRAVLTEPVRAPRHKRAYVRVSLQREDRQWHATPVAGQGSHQLAGLVRADGLAEVPAHVTQLEAGDRVAVHLLVDW